MDPTNLVSVWIFWTLTNRINCRKWSATNSFRVKRVEQKTQVTPFFSKTTCCFAVKVEHRQCWPLVRNYRLRSVEPALAGLNVTASYAEKQLLRTTKVKPSLIFYFRVKSFHQKFMKQFLPLHEIFSER